MYSLSRLLLLLLAIVLPNFLNAGWFSDLESETDSAKSKPIRDARALVKLQNVYEESFHKPVDESKKISFGKSTNGVFVSFYFSGFSMDEELGEFYYFLMTLGISEMLNPILLDQNFINRRCLMNGAKSINNELIFEDDAWEERDFVKELLELRSGQVTSGVSDNAKYGITQAAYSQWQSGSVLNHDLEGISFDEAYRFYKESYLSKQGYDKIESPGLKAKLFESAVIHGNRATVRWIQRAVNRLEDGMLSEDTVQAINERNSVELQGALDQVRRKALKCYELEKAAIEYGLFVSEVPPSFYKTYSSLKKKYRATIVPGIKWTPYESIVRKYIEKELSDKNICREYRFDGRSDCVLKKSKNVHFIKSQGLKTRLLIPNDKLEEVIGSFINHFVKREAFQFGKVGFSIESELEKHGYEGVEIESLDCEPDSLKRGDLPFASLGEVKNHVNDYLDFFFGGEAWEGIGELDYPYVTFLDSETKDSFGQIVEHPDLTETSFVAEKTVQDCIRFAKSRDDGHGLFSLGILVAKKNGKGIVGLIPDIPVDRIELIDTTGPYELQRRINDLSESANYTSQDRLVVNISLGVNFSGDTSSRYYKDMESAILLSSDNVLWVVSAGNDGAFIGNCSVLPGCFGDLPNVITVSAMGKIQRGVPIRQWKDSNWGGGVSVSAPGVGIVSTDLAKVSSEVGGEYLPICGIRDGTSFSAAFVTALAARLWAQYPNLSAQEIKSRIVATAKPVLPFDRDDEIHLGGAMQQVQAGAIHPAIALRNPEDTLVLFEQCADPVHQKNRCMKSGRIKWPKGQNAFVLFVNDLTAKSRSCRMRNLLRISKKLDGYRIVCSKSGKNGKKMEYIKGVLESKRAQPMPCVVHQNCFTLKSEDGSIIDIDLKAIREIYFPVN
ncbi:MAG: S8 family serine peptidase [Chromatiales bacterium]|jgi:hypothetical protein